MRAFCACPIDMVTSPRRFALLLISLAGSVYAAQCNATQGQQYINNGQLNQAVNEFTCLINQQPTEVEGYRGRIEAYVLLGRYSDAVRDYTSVLSFVNPVYPNVKQIILDGYTARLNTAPNDLPALKGYSFARWWYFDYPQAAQVLKSILAMVPDDPYATLFLGHSLLSSKNGKNQGRVELDAGIALAPSNPHVRFIVADAFTYGQKDPVRAFDEASLALAWGLNTPRVHAILAVSYEAFGQPLAAALERKICIDLAATHIDAAAALGPGQTVSLPLSAGQVYEIPVAVSAGQTLSIATSSRDFWDSILVVLAPDGTAVASSDDTNKYYAAVDWVAGVTATYRLRVTSFESASNGVLVVTRQ
jgi:tetratricopeptide (TPR) repeat protein